ncbi:MAG: hypothetical protein L6R39_000929 [Caloplaca ligustica]|nr:MAG: hypothetical protein L6R39_000929 [Caloplaca ligustica]
MGKEITESVEPGLLMWKEQGANGHDVDTSMASWRAVDGYSVSALHGTGYDLQTGNSEAGILVTHPIVSMPLDYVLQA